MTSPLISKIIKTIIVLLLYSGVVPTVSFAEESIRIGGAGAGLGLLKNLAAVFEKSNPGIKVIVLPSLGSSGGIKALNHGALDIAISSRALTAEESTTGVIPVELGKTPFIFIVHTKVNKADVTLRELIMIYKEEFRSWPNGVRIRVVYRPQTDTDTFLLANISKEMKQALDHANTIKERRLAVTDQETVEIVEKIPGAFGASTLTQVITEHPAVKILSYNGVIPSIEAIGKGSYPLAKPLYLITTKNISPSAQQFVNFMLSAKGQALAATMGILPTPRVKGDK